MKKKDGTLKSMLNVFSKKQLGFWLAIMATFIVFIPSLNNGIVSWDDPDYVLNNPHIREFSIDGIIGIFKTKGYLANYQPLTLISYAIDHAFQSQGFDIYHIHNLILHLLNVGLVYMLTLLLFEDRFIGSMVAILFGIHPMHVESVAWISGRKDMLYVMYFLLGSISYTKYLRSDDKRWWYFLASMLFFLLSCLAKGQAVIFPVVLLLILFLKRRFSITETIRTAPFFILSAFLGILAMRLQNQGGATNSTEVLTGYSSIFISSYTMFIYMLKSVVPFKLSAFHPYPSTVSGNFPWWIYASIIPTFLVVGLTGFQFKSDRKMFFGFAFFFVTIFLVSQIIPVGRSIISDRYSYLSYIGLFIVLALILQRGYKHLSSIGKQVAATVLGVYIVLLGVQTFARCAVWENSGTLWKDVTEKYPHHFMAYSNLGKYHWDTGNPQEAEQAFRKCLENSQQRPECANNLGLFLKGQNRQEEALKAFDRSIAIDSSYYAAVLNRGMLLSQMDRNELALQDMNRLVQINSDTVISYLFRAIVLEKLIQYENAVADYGKLIAREPENAAFYSARGLIHFKLGDANKAMSDYNMAIETNPNFGEAYYRRSRLFWALGNKLQAISNAEQAMTLKYPVPDQYLVQLRSLVE